MQVGIPKPRVDIAGTVTRSTGEVVPFKLSSTKNLTQSEQIKLRKRDKRNKHKWQ